MSEKNYALETETPAAFVAPTLDYKPKTLKKPAPGIALIGAGGISEQHLTAYQNAGYPVLSICDVDLARATEKRDKFFPKALATDKVEAALATQGVEVADITTHPEQRAVLIRAALDAGKHVLSQKPFVVDLGVGEELVAQAKKAGKLLAVNQNGRWAPHVSTMRAAVKEGLIGEVLSVHCNMHWNHDWCAGTPFDEVHHLILYDFAIHWFDMMHCYIGDKKATRVSATITHAAGQTAKPPLLGQAIIAFEGGQASLVFDGFTPVGALDTTTIVGTKGMLRSVGGSLGEQTTSITTTEGTATFELEGSWFPGGFHGAMAELLSAIEDGREPSHSAENNLKSLETCFAALRSADTGLPQTPGEIRSL